MFPERLLSSFGLINICSLPIHSCEKKRNQFLRLQMQKLLSEAMHLIFFRVSTHLSFGKNTIDFSGTFNEVILYTNVSFKKAILVSCMRAIFDKIDLLSRMSPVLLFMALGLDHRGNLMLSKMWHRINWVSLIYNNSFEQNICVL